MGIGIGIGRSPDPILQRKAHEMVACADLRMRAEGARPLFAAGTDVCCPDHISPVRAPA